MDKQMAYTMETECMTIKALAMKNATKRHLLLDATKLTRIGFYAIAPFSSFDTIICNRADQPAGEPSGAICFGVNYLNLFEIEK